MGRDDEIDRNILTAGTEFKRFEIRDSIWVLRCHFWSMAVYYCVCKFTCCSCHIFNICF